MAAHAFEHIQNVFLFDERHFAVYLRKFGLTVGTQIFVAETFHNLEIAVESADHQQLFQCLRTLRQSVELPLIHAARHHKIARAFGRGVDQNGRFYLQKSLFVEIAAHLESHFVAQFEIFAHARTPQVEVTIFHAQVVAAVGFVFDGERRRGSLVQHVQFGNDDFDIARGHIGIFAVALGHCTGYLNNVFAPEVICFFAQFGINLLIESKLRNSVTVAQVDKGHSAHFADALHPAGKGYRLSDVGGTKFAASCCSVHSDMFLF